ncbi:TRANSMEMBRANE PROTEIN [Salix koriyanagi]|uniref:TRANSMEMBRANE PROTEIN n=1 Tax=Salix koriyanagi TaxID=2511006 RepID=A0A9Q0W0Z1_9ROSI|nr:TRANSMEMBRANE PROTEIN [Salix koriyanagi]
MLCHGLLSFTLLLLTSVSHGASVPFPSFSALPPAVVGRADGAKYEVEFSWGTRRPVVEAPIGEPVDNSPVLVLAPKRTYRKDPLSDFKRYTGGWNISDRHYWAVSLQLLCLLSLQSGSWFLGCAYSLVAFVISVAKGSALAILEQLILSPSFSSFSSAFVLSLDVLFYILLRKDFHKSTTETLEYVVNQADATVDKLRAVSDFIASAKLVGVDQVFLPSNVQTDIDQIGTRINSSASVLADKTVDNSEDIKDLLDSVRVALITAAAIMLLLTFLGFLFSIFGMQFLVYILVIVGWILVAGTFILCGTFLLLHNVAGDTCVAMDHWVQNPTAHTALDDILPCVDQATTQDTLIKSKEITSQLVEVVNQVITNVSNLNFSPNFKPMYINQSGPLVPMLCNPFYADLTIRPCSAGEVELTNATQVWSSYVCQVSPTGICSTTGRLTPAFYSQMSAAVNVSYGLNNNAPFLIDLGDCTFAREIFNEIYRDHCPSLRRYSRWIYIGLVMVSTAVMLSLIFWVIYGRERRHRVYSKQLVSESAQGAEREKRS